MSAGYMGSFLIGLSCMSSKGSYFVMGGLPCFTLAPLAYSMVPVTFICRDLGGSSNMSGSMLA